MCPYKESMVESLSWITIPEWHDITNDGKTSAKREAHNRARGRRNGKAMWRKRWAANAVSYQRIER